MQWIFWTVVLLLCVYHRTFRYLCLSLMALAGLTVGVLWWANHQTVEPMEDETSISEQRSTSTPAAPVVAPAFTYTDADVAAALKKLNAPADVSTPGETETALRRLRARVKAHTP